MFGFYFGISGSRREKEEILKGINLLLIHDWDEEKVRWGGEREGEGGKEKWLAGH